MTPASFERAEEYDWGCAAHEVRLKLHVKLLLA